MLEVQSVVKKLKSRKLQDPQEEKNVMSECLEENLCTIRLSRREARTLLSFSSGLGMFQSGDSGIHSVLTAVTFSFFARLHLGGVFLAF
jgi:hypothetical protein